MKEVRSGAMPTQAVTTRSTLQPESGPAVTSISAAAKLYRSMLSKAKRVWGNEVDAVAWLNNGHPELQNATSKSLLGTAAGERTVENLLASLEYGFSV
jgi:uncharacterized protein (DUF2384 family)